MTLIGKVSNMKIATLSLLIIGASEALPFQLKYPEVFKNTQVLCSRQKIRFC